MSATKMSGGALQRFARRATEAARAFAERCDLCDEPVPPGHRHLLESDIRSVVCVCQACALLFSQPAASLGKYRLIPDRCLRLADFDMTDAEWESLRVPVGLCFITAERAYYPGPMGATEGHLDPATWSALSARHRILAEIEPQLEALLINRARGAHEHFIVPIDTCFNLVGLMRSRWRGLTGGSEVWTDIRVFFETLHQRSGVVWSRRES